MKSYSNLVIDNHNSKDSDQWEISSALWYARLF